MLRITAGSILKCRLNYYNCLPMSICSLVFLCVSLSRMMMLLFMQIASTHTHAHTHTHTGAHAQFSHAHTDMHVHKHLSVHLPFSELIDHYLTLTHSHLSALGC